MNLPRLKTTLTKFESPLKVLLTFFCENKDVNIFLLYELSIEKLNLFLESSLKDHIINLFNSKIDLFESYVKHLCSSLYNKSSVTEHFCCLLSYGLEITEGDINLLCLWV